MDYSISLDLLHMAEETVGADREHGLGLITVGDWAHGLQSTRECFEHVNNNTCT
jgi:hypothetical protein